jgi:hypothetical protein
MMATFLPCFRSKYGCRVRGYVRLAHLVVNTLCGPEGAVVNNAFEGVEARNIGYVCEDKVSVNLRHQAD